ncbi:unnamed protein product [Caenorhabditis bovis]|uniref:Ephrin RBD domain-containing protein n=1 Tax=Caenorhabditis bovis TaxID=2654633 RepID=A0A8S1F7I7_9PELO|nr:unnamed protein product [Caenorhabditis bovis]
MRWWLHIVIAAAQLLASIDARKIPDIYWNSTNHIFEISNTEHVMSVRIGDRVTIRCPAKSANYEYSYIYMVSEEEYTHCYLQNPRLVAACDNETTPIAVNMVFRSFTPTPGGFEFEAGKNYYMISTSDGSLDGIDRKKDGLCATKKMKVKFEVLPSETSPKFAARTFSEDSTPIMYVIHNEDDDDDASNAYCHLTSMIVALIAAQLML